MKKKNKSTALIFSVLLGGLGVDRFYLGYTGIGILKLLTGGCFGILWIVDIVFLLTGKLVPADGSEWDEDAPLFGSTNRNGKTIDSADEILKFKELLDAGAITQEEFDRKKKEILEGSMTHV